MIRDAVRADFSHILALNLAFESMLSPLDAARLADLDRMAAYHRLVDVDGTVAAFALALAPGTGYDSVNYRWFEARYDHFLYVDRIVVGGEHQGRRLARALYEDLIVRARAQAATCIVAEFDVEPPNDASRRFHASFGFVEVGSQRAGAAGKRVSLQRLELAST